MSDEPITPTNPHRLQGEEVARWLGFLAGMTLVLVLLLFPRQMFKDEPSGAEIWLYLGLFVMPAFISALLALVGRFWVLIVTGLFYVAWGFTWRLEKRPPGLSVLFLVAAVIILMIPFMVWGLKQKPKVKKG